MAAEVLSTRQLNRALLARQLLLERSSASLVRAIERVGGLQTQYAPSGYIGLWTRLRHFQRADLTGALERRKVIQGTLLRVTIHMVSASDYPPLVEAIKNERQAWWMRVHRKGIEGLDMMAVANRVRDYLENGPLRQSELIKRLEDDGFGRVAWSGAGLWVDLVRVPPSGTWERRRADLYGLAESWLGSWKITEEHGLEHLIRRYLGAFGPATLNNLATWAGISPAIVRPIVERLPLRRFRDEQGAELLDLPRAPLPDAETVAPVRFLPTWDATLLVHARRTQILPEQYRHVIFNTKMPQSVPTFLVDGAVAGKWRYEGGRVKLEPFAPLPRPVRRQLEEEAEALAAFHSW